jgi:hypothetical protein
MRLISGPLAWLQTSLIVPLYKNKTYAKATSHTVTNISYKLNKYNDL